MQPGLDPNKQKELEDWLAENMGTPPETEDVPRGTDATAFEANNTPVSNDADSYKVDSSHPAPSQDELDQFYKTQEANLDRFGPDKEEAVMKKLMEEYKSPRHVIGKGLAGLGDAIMQGVARAGSGNFMNSIEQEEQNTIKNTSDQLAHLQDTNAKSVNSKMNLERMRPGSALNKSATPVLEATLKTMGVPDDQISKYLANPDEARKAIDVLKDVIPAKDKIKIENELKLIELQLMARNQAQTHQEKTAQQGIEKEKNAQDAAKALSSRGILQRATDFVTGNPAVKTLESQLPGNPENIPSVTSKAEYDALPKGATYKTADGKRKVKS